MNDRENYYQQHRCCPQCGGQSFEQQLGRHTPHLAGEPYRDHGGTTCNGCGWKGTVHDLRPEGLTVDEVLAKPAGPQPEEEPITIDALVRRLRQRQQALEEERSRCRREEYRHLAHTYEILLANRINFLDREATKLALRIALQVKTLSTKEQTPDDAELTELRILCGTRSAVPSALTALYIALHGIQKEAAAPVDRRAVDHLPGHVRCVTCGKAADLVLERGEGGIPGPVLPDGWGIVPSVEGILCPECVAAERRLQRP